MASSQPQHTMPGLTLDSENNTNNTTFPAQPLQPSQPSQQHSPARSRSSSPVQPPYSPITPTLAAARLATESTPTTIAQPPQQPARVYTHSQPPQTFVPPPHPPPENISLDSNPDALALRSAISILQIQRQKATADIQTLQQIKERALADPAAFADALASGQIRTKPDTLFGDLTAQDAEENNDEDDENDDDAVMEVERETSNVDTTMKDSSQGNSTKPWPHLPKPQNIIRTPPINWTQYGVVGDPLDKLHADQVMRPMEGLPARIGPDGQIIPVEGGKRNEGIGVAAPYIPGRDKIEKTSLGTKKGGKR